MHSALKTLFAASCLFVATAVPAWSALLGKTIDASFQICLSAAGQCTPKQRFHAYVSPSGQIFSFNSAAGGGRHALGQTFTADGNAGRFTLEGDSLVFDYQGRDAANSLTARVVVQTSGSRCSVSGAGQITGGANMPIAVRSGGCRVYEGRKAF